MSRLIVKGLPSYLTDVRLREHFSQKGAVTDVKLMKRPDGTSRRFGFVGFRTESEAQAAQEYFDRTYIDTSRISVAVAKQVNDEDLRAQKEARRHARTPVRAPSPPPKSQRSDKSASFEEFLSVMAPKRKRPTWQNNEDMDAANDAAAPAPAPAQDTQRAKKQRKKDEPAHVEAPADGAAADEGLTDLEYMRRRMRHHVAGGAEAPARAFEQSDSEAESDTEVREAPEEAAAAEREREALERQRRADEANVDTIMASGRLFVRNLPFSATEDELMAFFATYGEVEQVHIPLDASTKASKGLAFVKYVDPAHALLAFRGRDGAIFQGRLLHVLPAVDLAPKPAAGGTLKQKRLDAKRAQAGKDFNWSVLYMNSDAVASSISDRLGVPKAALLGTEDESHVSPAVRLALAETRVIQETKQFFSEHGMDLEALDGARRARSDTVILVKNIPYGTAGEEIRALFARFGDVARVLIPPSNTIAVVEMPVVGEARAAFRGLAYKRFRDAVLYLEKAPEGFLPPRAARGTEVISGVQGKAAPASSRSLLGVEPEAASSAAPVDGATLYVKNLSFATTSARLQEAFGALDGLAFARVQTKPDPQHAGQRLSMGYGFVGFASAAQAAHAQRVMDQHVLDGHTLSVSLARRGHDADDAAPGAKAPSSKMLVKNVPFEATKKDLRELFSVHGQLKSVRVPKQVHGRTRGFAFVEFVSRREAENAMAALRHTHLLGRHLVLEWAGDADGTASVDELRAKTQASYVSETGRSSALGERAKLRVGPEQMADVVARARADADDM